MVNRTTEPLLDLRGIWKSYQPGVYAVRDVSMSILPGEVHGLMGGNGAGKSTLMKIIAGAHRPDRGEITWRGRPTSWSNPSAAASAGIGTVHQNVPLAPQLSVIENVFLPRKGIARGGRKLTVEFERLCDSTGFHFPADVLVERLSIGQRQMVAIMQALATKPSLLVLDEPTASLAEPERNQLFETMASISKEGTAILFCSHFIEEVLETTDRVTIMRGGEVMVSDRTAVVTPDSAAQSIAGRNLLQMEQHLADEGDMAGKADEIKLTGMRLRPGARSFDLTIKRGEVLGLAGLMGSGQSLLLRQLFAAEPLDAETAVLADHPYPTSIRAAIARGVAYVGDDRVRQSLFPLWEVWRNLSLPYLRSFSRWRSIENVPAEKGAAVSIVESLSVKAASIAAPVSSLSGGNAQKVAIGRWLGRRPEVLLLDDPTVGVDVGAKADILGIITQLARQGTTVVLTSSDFGELAAVSHRIGIVVRGSVTDVVPNDGLTEAKVVALINGYSEEGDH